MALQRVSGPAVTPITREDLLNHLRLSGEDDDGTLDNCLAVAVAMRDGDDGELGRALIEQTWLQDCTAIPRNGESLELLLPSVSSVVSVEYRDMGGDWQTADPVDFEVFAEGGRSCLASDNWPRRGASRVPLRVTFVAGYGPAATDVPEQIRQAMILLASHFYSHRDLVVMEGKPVELPISVNRLLAPFKIWWR